MAFTIHSTQHQTYKSLHSYCMVPSNTHTHTGNYMYLHLYSHSSVWQHALPTSASVIPFTMPEFFPEHFVWKISKIFLTRNWVRVKNECRAIKVTCSSLDDFSYCRQSGRSCAKIPTPTGRQTDIHSSTHSHTHYTESGGEGRSRPSV